MKKKIVNAFLMMALIASSMGTFVSCKDYDEDAYVDLRNRISNEVSLRDALQKQVDNLEKALADLKAVAVTKDELAQTLKSYLTKEDAANTYVTLKVYNEYITNNDAKLVLINNAIKDLEAQIADIKKDMDEPSYYNMLMEGHSVRFGYTEVESQDEVGGKMLEIANVFEVMDRMRGFSLDRAVNMLGNTGWGVIWNVIHGEDLFKAAKKRYNKEMKKQKAK